MIKNTGAFVGKTIFVSGGSRGIGKAIAVKLAQDGANVVIAAKTTEPHPKLEGTIFSTAKDIENAGGKCLPVQCDLRNEEAVSNAVKKAVEKFGTIDILINNASAISLTNTEETSMKKYDLMNQINTRGTYMTTKYCLPYLKQGKNSHVLMLSPPLEMKPVWFGKHVAYSIAKYGMSMCVLGMAEEFKPYGIGVNALWPRTAIWTAAMAMLGGGQEEMANVCRKVDIMSDAAYAILSKDSKQCTGNFFIDEELLRSEGIKDFESYAVKPGEKLLADFFIPERLLPGLLHNYGDDLQPSSDDGTPAPQSSGIPAPADDKIMKFLDEAKTVVTDSLKNDINAVIVFVVGDRAYLFDCHSSRPLKIDHVGDPKTAPKSDVTLITDETTFTQMAKGDIKPTSAFMAGKLKITGNINLAMKVEKIFKAHLKSKK